MGTPKHKETISNYPVLGFLCIEQTIICLKQSDKFHLAEMLENILKNNLVEKPKLHNKKQETWTNRYFINLPLNVIDEIETILLMAEASTVDKSGKATSLTTHYSTLVDQWSSLYFE